ncbi:MAG: NAD(P)/FAD-dependent oxidoreductase [Leptospiraceae bacterium]|nr:NAD(P)/FAD-dependent oxidoreductase [Leptospiraceae bacterium]MCP5512197.1 NAD(P)/FAD-dependent oxidoreductase [Leptospiraceae bacterium]
MKSIALIGAGFSGLGMAYALKKEILEFDHYEKNPALGGNWRYGVYETVHIISSKKTTSFQEYPMPSSYPDFPSSGQMLAYLESYADTFHLKENIQFDSDIIDISPHGERWILTFSGGEKKIYEFVIIANGHHWDPKYPDIKGSFDGEIIHSKDYKNPEILKNKRVLVIGGGNSALDIAVEAARFSISSHISMKSGRWIIPKSIFGIPSIEFLQPWIPDPLLRQLVQNLVLLEIGSFEKYGLQNPDYTVLDKHPTINSLFLYYLQHGRIVPHKNIESVRGNTFTFVDGSQYEADLLVCGTGFHMSFPMLQSLDLRYSSRGIPELINGLFPRKYKNLILFGGVGQPRYGAGPVISAAAGLVAKLLPIQKEIQLSLGELFFRMGQNPLESEVIDPFTTMRRAEALGKMTGFLPFLDQVLRMPFLEGLYKHRENDIMKKFNLPAPQKNYPETNRKANSAFTNSYK